MSGETARIVCPVHGIPDCSPLLNGCSEVTRLHQARQDVERHDPRCPVDPCACADIARRVRDADARLARQIRGEVQPNG